VTVLSDSTFDEIVLKSNDIWIVEFYAPWCSHCKKLKPEYEQAAKNLKGIVKFGMVDATVEKELSKRFEIKSFP
jgi:protein disulfide-isomerase A6